MAQYRAYYEQHKEYLREGQALFNTLSRVWPNKAEEILATEFDCFYLDKNIYKTLSELTNSWPLILPNPTP